MAWVPLPIGIDNFEKVVKGGYYFVDKTLFIRELLDMKGEVNLFTRPRRFGKTLNMSMLRYFFEKGKDRKCGTVSGAENHGCRGKISGADGKISGDQHLAEIYEAALL